MTMRLLQFVAIAVVAMSGVSCAITTVETSYDQALIDELGAGSEALQNIFDVMSPPNIQPDFNDAAAELIFRGELDKLTAEDLKATVAISRENERQFRRVLRRLKPVAGEVRRAQVEVAAHSDLSEGAQEFIRAWNDYLSVNADRTKRLRRSLGGMNVWFDRYEELVQAVRETARLGSTVEFARMRDDILEDVTADARGRKKLFERILAETPVEQRIRDLVNNDQEANAMVERVNDEYPDGFLADVMK